MLQIFNLRLSRVDLAIISIDNGTFNITFFLTRNRKENF